MGRADEGKKVMLTAVNHPTATLLTIHQAGRMFQQMKRPAEALEIFEINAKRHGDVWPVNVGLARGFMGVGNLEKALEYARKAAAQAPDDLNKRNLAAMVESLAAGKVFSNE